nr:hypothetical protein [Halomonas socia]
MGNMYVCLDDLDMEIYEKTKFPQSVPHIQQAIETHLNQGGSVVLELRYANAPLVEKYSFSDIDEFKRFLEGSGG